MNKSAWSYGLVFVTLILLSFFPISMPSDFRLNQTVSPTFQSFPVTLGDWKGEDTPVDQRTYEILETRNILSRVYKNSNGDSVHVLLVGSERDRRVAHPPEVCYTGSNYSISSSGESDIFISGSSIKVKTFTARSEKDQTDQQEVLYLYKIGSRYTTNYYAQQLQFALDRLSQKDSQVLLIRLAGTARESFPDLLEKILSHL